MADPDKIPETQSDPEVSMECSPVTESQDFHLVDCDETQKETQIELDKDAKEDLENCVQGSAEILQKDSSLTELSAGLSAKPASTENDHAQDANSDKDANSVIEKKEENPVIENKEEASVIEKTEETPVMENEDGTVKNKNKMDTDESKIDVDKEEELLQDDDDDDDTDFIQSSQIDSLSPLKKQISGLVGTMSQKRKADSIDQPVAKFPRTCSQEDALGSVRKRLDDEIEEIFSEGKDGPDDEVLSSIIIAETQESQQSQDAVTSPETLQQVEQELKETLSQHSLENEEELFGNTEEKTEIDEKKAEEKNEEKSVNSKNEAEAEPSKVSEDLDSADLSIDSKVKDIVRKKMEETLNTTEPSVILDDTKEKSIIDLVEASSTPKAAERPNDEIGTGTAKTPGEIALSKSPETPAIPDGTKDKTVKELAEASSTPKSSANETSSQSKDSKSEGMGFIVPTTSSRSRMSIEVIYDRATAPPEKKPPRELVEIDEDGEKIILDSSQESCDKSMDKSADKKILDTSYKTCSSTDYKSLESGKESSGKETSGNEYKSGYSLTNGSTGSRIVDSSTITTTRSEKFSTDSSNEKKSSAAQSPMKKLRETSGNPENPEILNISDSDESFAVDDRSKLKESLIGMNHDNSNIKTVSIEKELNILVKLKCLVYIDETTKEQVEKIITSVHCESASADFSSLRPRTVDNSANLADISGNEKDSSPGSVTSNVHPYPLNSRLSLVSVASTSSTSSAGSLNAKLSSIKFQLPRGPAKHAKKMAVADSTEKKAENDEALEQIKKEWKNVDTVTCTIMSFANQELNSSDHHNGSTLRVDNSLERIRSSTPEVNETDQKVTQSTPKRGARKSRSVSATTKTTRVKNLRSSDANGEAKESPVADVRKSTPSRKRKQSPEIPTNTPTRQATTKIVVSDDVNIDDDDDLVGKQVFAKWSDNKYYPGTVTAKTKTKFRVNFYDGQSKLIIEDFIVPMPATLNQGLSVYATSDENDYGSCGIILDVKKVRDGVVYIVETDEGEKIEVDIKNIFLTNDQVQVLREEVKIEMKTPPSTPKHLGKVTLENVVDGKRRSKRILTPVTTTPKTKRMRGSTSEKKVDPSKPSASGVSTSRVKFEENHETTSDSNFSEFDDGPDSIGVQEEIVSTSYELVASKGQQSTNKGKGRGRNKSETPEIIANLGPMPSENSDIFKGMSFILSCASLETIVRYQAIDSSNDSNSDPGTENEEEWDRKPFVRERLTAQIVAAGGKVYETFESIPSEEYENTKHITNVPNITKKSLLCLSVGIKSYNHQWIIRCCQQNKLVNPSEEELPAGWSLMKKTYVEMFQRRSSEPFRNLPVVVVIPVTPGNDEFVSFWKKICENAGGSVLLVKKPDDDFIQGTVVLTNKHCPSWVKEKASEWKIPLVSTKWVIECLVEGDLCNDDAHPSFKYNHVKRSVSHISHLKRR